MEYRLGNSFRVREQGDTLETICPDCKKTVKFGVFSNFEGRLAPKLPFLECNTVYFLVCPECAGIFTVDEKKGKEFRKGNKFAITDTDLTKLEQFGKSDDNE